jgi:hypothetical protein
MELVCAGGLHHWPLTESRDEPDEVAVFQGRRAYEGGLLARGEQLSHAPDVIAVPVSGNHEPHGAFGRHVQGLEIGERNGLGRTHRAAGIDEDPFSSTKVHADALAHTGAEEGDFDLVVSGWPAALPSEER